MLNLLPCGQLGRPNLAMQAPQGCGVPSDLSLCTPCSVCNARPCIKCLQGEAVRVARESFFAAEEDDLGDLPQEFKAQLPMSFGALNALYSEPINILSVSIIWSTPRCALTHIELVCSGKQQPATSNRVKIHESTRRTGRLAADEPAELASGPQMGPPRPARLRASNDEPQIGPPRPGRLNERASAHTTGVSNTEDGPAPASEQAEELVGPPRPQRLQAEALVGPPRPATVP